MLQVFLRVLGSCVGVLVRFHPEASGEAVESWAKIAGSIITILIGVIGAIIGLVAILKK